MHSSANDAIPNQAITTRGLTRRFGDKFALDGLDLDIPVGQVFGLLGHNGAGKTTAVRILNGVLAPTSGSATVLGRDPSIDGARLRQRTGVSTETPSLDDRLTGLASLEIFADLYGVPRNEVAPRVDELLDRFDLTAAATLKVGGYSKGMRQRLALARCLLHDPELLFLDEPTSGLDPVASRQVSDLILHLSRERGKTVLLCTHDLKQAQELCERVAVLEHGKLVALGRPRELARGLGQGQLVTIETSPNTLERAVRTLEADPSIDHVENASGSLKFSVADRDRVPALVYALVNEGVELYQVNLAEPSLEDVYFSLHRKQKATA